MTGIRVRKAVSDDIDELGRLFELVFGTTRDPRIWQWKYFRNPFGTHSWVAERDGRIVFHCGGTPVPFSDEGRRITALQLTDFMRGPSRADGIGPGGAFVRTTSRFFEDIVNTRAAELLYGFPGERHLMAGERILDYRSAFPVWEAQIEPEGPPTLAPRSLQEGDLVEFEGSGHGLRMDRSQDLLRWRYISHPENPYSVVEADGKPIAIVRVMPDEIRLMEIAADQGVDLRGFDRLGKTVIGWFPRRHGISAKLEEAGFSFSRRDHRIAAAWISESADIGRRRYFDDRIAEEADFYYTLGDYDVW